MTFSEIAYWTDAINRRGESRTKAVIEVDIDAKQKRLAFIRKEERQLVEELSVLWKERSELTCSATAANAV
ncbi:hypothetical protein VPHD148_0223 [Vibrio phage D148]